MADKDRSSLVIVLMFLLVGLIVYTVRARSMTLPIHVYMEPDTDKYLLRDLLQRPAWTNPQNEVAKYWLYKAAVDADAENIEPSDDAGAEVQYVSGNDPVQRQLDQDAQQESVGNESDYPFVIQGSHAVSTHRSQATGMPEERLCFTGRDLNDVFVPCKPGKLGPRLLPPETSIIETAVMPLFWNLIPEISNGHVATVVQSSTVFMNGLYNGANTSSHRARIPSTASVRVDVAYPLDNITGKFSLDLGRGFFSELYSAEGFSVEVRRYAHRDLTRLLVTEIVVNRTTSTLPITLSLTVHPGSPSEDIDFVEEKPGVWTGQTKVAEYPEIAGTTPVTVVYSLVPPMITFAPSTSGTLAFLTAVSTDKTDALKHYSEGEARLLNGTLFSSHVQLWDALWQQGRIEMSGNDSMALATNAAFYYLLSALPLKADADWPFVGMSPGGLAHGSAGQDYDGHVFWDQDTWMFPPIALLHVDLGRLIVGTRLRTHDTAVLYANSTDLKGARYPWESAFTGLNTSPSVETTEYELHVTGDVSLMMRQYLQLTNDTDFLTTDGGYTVLADIANFWLSRSVFNKTKQKYEILGVMGPDEYHFKVNNSVYTNAIAAQSMITANNAAKQAGQEPVALWDIVANNMHFPFDDAHLYHPEFDNYSRGVKVKQADVILLGFPIMWPMLDTVRENDLYYYANVTPGGPAMTWGAFAINYLRLNKKSKADEAFYRGTWNIQDPFKVWSENADGTGAFNFQTGMGGYLQSLLYGYFGFDIHDDQLDFNPQLPPSLSTMAVRGLDYRGASLDLLYSQSLMTVTLTKAGTVPLLLLLERDKKTITLKVGDAVSADRQAASLLTSDNGSRHRKRPVRPQ